MREEDEWRGVEWEWAGNVLREWGGGCSWPTHTCWLNDVCVCVMASGMPADVRPDVPVLAELPTADRWHRMCWQLVWESHVWLAFSLAAISNWCNKWCTNDITSTLAEKISILFIDRIFIYLVLHHGSKWISVMRMNILKETPTMLFLQKTLLAV